MAHGRLTASVLFGQKTAQGRLAAVQVAE